MPIYGTRMQVWVGEGGATQTRYGLKKEDLVMSKGGKVVSKKKSQHAIANKTEYLEKMNSRRTRRSAPQVTIRPTSTETQEVSVPGNTTQRPAVTRDSRLRALTAAAARTY